MNGSIVRRGKRSWAVIIDVDTDGTGKRRQKWHSVKGTRKDAERESARLINLRETGMYVEPTRLTVSDYLKKWLEHAAKLNLTGKSYERYTEIVHLHLVPALGSIVLAKLRPLHI